MLEPIKAAIKAKKRCKADYRDAEIVALRQTIRDICAREKAVFVLGCWVGYGDLCLEMAFWGQLKKKYPDGKFFFAIPEDKRWVLEAYDVDKRLEVLPVSYEAKTKLESPFLFRKIKREFAKKTRLVYGKVACRGHLILKGDWRIGLPLLKCYRRSLGIKQSVCPVPMPYSPSKEFRDAKAVIFNLKSKSLFMDDVSPFVALARACIKEGYRIIFNQNGFSGIQGEVFDGSIQELRDLFGRCGLLVSIRSGIMDLAIGTGINMLAIYPKKKDLKAYTLKQWESSTENIVEVLSSQVVGNEDALIKAFM